MFLKRSFDMLACLIVIAGFHDFSSSRIDRQTVPDGYTLGWKSGGLNLPGHKSSYNDELESLKGTHTWVAWMDNLIHKTLIKTNTRCKIQLDVLPSGKFMINLNKPPSQAV